MAEKRYQYSCNYISQFGIGWSGCSLFYFCKTIYYSPVQHDSASILCLDCHHLLAANVLDWLFQQCFFDIVYPDVLEFRIRVALESLVLTFPLLFGIGWNFSTQTVACTP